MELGETASEDGEWVQVDLSTIELSVLRANALESAAHEALLADIDKASKGRTVWRQQEPA
jgi:DNA polymerase-3 subunit epsilon